VTDDDGNIQFATTLLSAITRLRETLTTRWLGPVELRSGPGSPDLHGDPVIVAGVIRLDGTAVLGDHRPALPTSAEKRLP
jgi:hypothetical protein